METAEKLITENLDVWTSAVKAKSSAGRGSSKKRELYGISKLRDMILDLAIRGMIVPQDPADEPATKLASKIEAVRKQKLTDGKSKKTQIYKINKENEGAGNVPSSWVMLPLGNIAFIQTGKLDANASSADGEYPFFTCAREPLRISRFAYDCECVLLAGNGNFDVNYYKGKFEAYQRTYIIEGVDSEMINGRYLYRFIQVYADTLREMSIGGVISYIKIGFLTGAPFPLPPLAEQHRIVAKVDELMALCDQLEQQQEDSLSAHETLVQTLLGTLTAASDNAHFTEAWQRIQANFDTLFTTESSIDQLKQTILQLAVMGKLVPQNTSDEPASQIFKKIAAEKRRLIKEKTIKKAKPVSPISEEELPFQIPDGWGWARFQSLSTSYHVGLDRGKSLQGNDREYRYFKMNNILNTGGFDLSDITSIDASAEEVEKFTLEAGELLFNTRNSRELVGKTCVFQEDGLGPVLYNNNILRARFSVEPISRILDVWMRSPVGKSELEKLKSGTTNVWAIYQGKLEGLVCPIPPLAEQHRIVARVGELMALCDQLKASLATAQATQLNLADSLVEQAIGSK